MTETSMVHTSYPQFSSTEGIQICTSRFSKISYDDDANLVTVGGGCIFSDNYDELWPNNIVGGDFWLDFGEEDTRSKITSTVLESTTLSRFRSFFLMARRGRPTRILSHFFWGPSRCLEACLL